jgi:uncharacterized protein (TIGR03086 family)
MTRASVTASRAGETELLRRAIRYACGTVRTVTPELLPHPTPCRGWDLRMLLEHASESLAALHEGISDGCLSLAPADCGGDTAAGPAQAFRDRAGLLLDASSGPRGRNHVIDIAGHPLAASAMAVIGALEIAVHGWDISQASGTCQPIPQMLAIDLLAIAVLLVPRDGRYPLFAPPVSVTAERSPSDQLVAFLGRTPSGSHVPA